MPNQISNNNCTACGVYLDSATNVRGYKLDEEMMPKPGDITVCIKCGHIMAFGDNLELRELTNQEAHDAAGDPDILAIQEARGAIKDVT
jgi:hypothetical protein